jgi:hypothetical protein
MKKIRMLLDANVLSRGDPRPWSAWDTLRTRSWDQEEGVDENVKIGSNGEDAGVLVYPEGELRGQEQNRWVSNGMRAGMGWKRGMSSQSEGMQNCCGFNFAG